MPRLWLYGREALPDGREHRRSDGRPEYRQLCLDGRVPDALYKSDVPATGVGELILLWTSPSPFRSCFLELNHTLRKTPDSPRV